MQQTPMHDMYNAELLQLIPKQSQKIIEIGCGSGVLAKMFKQTNPSCHYLGVEINEEYANHSATYCDECITLNIEEADDTFWLNQSDRDCWIFGDVLEHLINPWEILRKIRQNLPPNGSIVACIPNLQHWSLQAKVNSGFFRYETNGLLDRTHLRWFTRVTIFEMFHEAGFKISQIIGRAFPDPDKTIFLPIIREMAKRNGIDPDQAEADAIPTQYVLVAIPDNFK